MFVLIDNMEVWKQF